MDIHLRALELACSKLCHDVISPIGAVNNGLELLEEEEDAALREEAAALAQRSAKRASVLLQVYRSALGNAGNQQTFGPREAVALAKEFLQNGKAQLSTGELPESNSVPAGYGKLTLNLIILGAESLPRGGTINLQVRSPQLGNGTIELDCMGQQIAWSEEFGRAINRNLQPEDLTAHNILPYVSAAFAQRLGMTLAITQSAPGILGILATSR
ncbi:histidine phosphotransferase family protein [Dongia deserti]|uniref:histidine phosphotransferase family protein n=1 Tax=Dongia deserti TaxID=2268030 RepID=UPI000E64F08F|nr:histidine phosphotransferase family protein [Dongia deserti]